MRRGREGGGGGGGGGGVRSGRKRNEWGEVREEHEGGRQEGGAG